jgi:hypothetical protein
MNTTEGATMKTQAEKDLLKLAQELAADGPADKHHDCSKALNEMIRMALASFGEDPADHGPGWDR